MPIDYCNDKICIHMPISASRFVYIISLNSVILLI